MLKNVSRLICTFAWSSEGAVAFDLWVAVLEKRFPHSWVRIDDVTVTEQISTSQFHKIVEDDLIIDLPMDKVRELLATARYHFSCLSVAVSDEKMPQHMRLCADGNPDLWDIPPHYQFDGSACECYVFDDNTLLALTNDTDLIETFKAIAIDCGPTSVDLTAR